MSRTSLLNQRKQTDPSASTLHLQSSRVLNFRRKQLMSILAKNWRIVLWRSQLSRSRKNGPMKRRKRRRRIKARLLSLLSRLHLNSIHTSASVNISSDTCVVWNRRWSTSESVRYANIYESDIILNVIISKLVLCINVYCICTDWGCEVWRGPKPFNIVLLHLLQHKDH